MNSLEIIVYVLEYFCLSLFILKSSIFTKLKYISKEVLLILFFYNCLICLINAYFHSGTGDDIYSYFSDAKVLIKYLQQDFFTYYQVLFKKGGGFIPYILAEPLFEIGHWGNPSKYLMVRAYTWFSLFSTTNIFNCSLFFAFISFSAKFLAFKICDLYQLSRNGVYLVLILLFFGGIDCFFITGMYKENLLFFFIIYIFYYFKSEKTILKHILFGLILYYLYILKPHLLGLMLISLLTYLVLLEFYTHKFFNKLLIALFLVVSVVLIFLFKVPDKLIDKKYQFNEMAYGNTKLDIFVWSDSIFINSINILKSFFGVFFTSFFNFSHSTKAYIVDFNNITITIVSIVLWYYSTARNKMLYYTTMILFIFTIIFIGILVPNYGAQLRYRSVYIIVWLLVLILNTKNTYIDKKNI